jgi:hypothetical protein
MKTASTSAPRMVHRIRQNHQLLERLDSSWGGSSSAACSCSSRPSSCAAASNGVSSEAAGRVGDDGWGDFGGGDSDGGVVWAPFAGAAAVGDMAKGGSNRIRWAVPRLAGANGDAIEEMSLFYRVMLLGCL